MDAKSIFIVVIILILLYYIVSTFLTSSGLTSMSGAEEQLTVPSSKLKSGGASNSAYSIWFYVDGGITITVITRTVDRICIWVSTLSWITIRSARNTT